MKKIIELNNITFAYHENNNVFKNVSLKINQGEFVCIVGPNGSGKSTLIKLFLGLEKPNYGSVTLFDLPPSNFYMWEKIGYVSQRANSFNTGFPATVEEVLKSSVVAKKGISKGKLNLDSKIDEALKIVGLEAKKQEMIGSLSGGQQQKVFLARLLINEPEVILLDEPMVGLDQKSQINLYDLIQYLNIQHGITVIMVTHDLRYVSKEVTKLICVEQGKIYCHEGVCCEKHNLQYHNHWNRLVGE